MEPHELAWAEALAQEHGHQRDLLATLHGELGAFAGECSNALAALDALVSLGPVAALLDDADTPAHSVALVRDVARRLPALARTAPCDDELSDFYGRLPGESDLSQAVVHQAGELLRADPGRKDGVILRAIIDAAGDRALIRQALGPAAVSAMYAITPLVRWAPSLAALEDRRGAQAISAREELAGLLQEIAGTDGTSLGPEAVELADPLRYTVGYLREAARAISRGALDQALAKAREQLAADLTELRARGESAQAAPHGWRTQRQAEQAELAAEVREKLEAVEKIRVALALALPDLQLAARALATVERVRDAEERIDARLASAADALRMLVLLTVNDVVAACLPESLHTVRRSRPLPRRWLLVAALVLAAAGAAIAVTVIDNGSGKPAAPNTILNVVPETGIPAAPTVSPLRAKLDPAQKATFYSLSVAATRQGQLIYGWRLEPPANDPGCNRFGSVFGSPNRAVWHHAASDGCADASSQLGTVTVTIKSRYWQCTASASGTQSGVGAAPKACTRI